MQHCTQNKIIIEEQAAGKHGSWGTTDQLQRIGIDKARIETVTQRIQKAALIGSVKVCKTALKM